MTTDPSIESNASAEADVQAVQHAFGTTAGEPGFNLRADLNSDGAVNALDLSIAAKELGDGKTAAGPIVATDPSDNTNPAVHTTDPTPADALAAPPRDDNSNLTGYYRRPPDVFNHQSVIVGDAEQAAIAARERNGMQFLGYKPEP